MAYGTAFWSIKAQIGTCREPIGAIIDQKAVPYAYMPLEVSSWQYSQRSRTTLET